MARSQRDVARLVEGLSSKIGLRIAHLRRGTYIEVSGLSVVGVPAYKVDLWSAH